MREEAAERNTAESHRKELVAATRKNSLLKNEKSQLKKEACISFLKSRKQGLRATEEEGTSVVCCLGERRRRRRTGLLVIFCSFVQCVNKCDTAHHDDCKYLVQNICIYV